MSGAWGVFWIFTIPIGGGIPAGVLMARDRGIPWPGMMVLYFLSDVLLAIVFEPVLKLMSAGARRLPRLEQAAVVFRLALERTTSHYGSAGGPLALIMVAFGVDPMTGRAAAAAAGHGFLAGWAIAITGDMMYFTVLMVSTLWLDSYLGNGLWTTIIMLALMFFLPTLLKKRAPAVAPVSSP